MNNLNMPPNKRTIIEPEEGWAASTWYLVDVAYRPTNPIHRSLFYSGFLNGGKNSNEPFPGGYNGLVPFNGPSFEDLPYRITEAHYLKVIRVILTPEEGRP